MSVESTNRIKSVKRMMFNSVDMAKEKKYLKDFALKNPVKNPFGKGPQTSVCTQCERKMLKTVADLQIKNQRENAPICVPCILGLKRKPLNLNKMAKSDTRRSKLIEKIKNMTLEDHRRAYRVRKEKKEQKKKEFEL